MQSFLTALVETLYEIAKDWLARRRDSQYQEREPILPSELDDWDAEFIRLTGKTIWQARCEADPELAKSQVDLSSAQNNIAVGYQALGVGYPKSYQHAQLQQQLSNQAAQQQQYQGQLSGNLGSPFSTLLVPGLSGLLGALGDSSKHPKS